MQTMSPKLLGERKRDLRRRVDTAAAPAAHATASTGVAQSNGSPEDIVMIDDFVSVEPSNPVEEAAAGAASTTPAMEPATEADAANPTAEGESTAEDVVWVKCRVCDWKCRGKVCWACFQAARADAIAKGRYVVGEQ